MAGLPISGVGLDPGVVHSSVLIAPSANGFGPCSLKACLIKRSHPASVLGTSRLLWSAKCASKRVRQKTRKSYFPRNVLISDESIPGLKTFKIDFTGLHANKKNPSLSGPKAVKQRKQVLVPLFHQGHRL